MSKVVKIVAYESLHQGGKPTVTVRATLDNGKVAESSVATNVAEYSYQNRLLLDNDPERYQGLGAQRAVHYINNLIAPKLAGVSPTKQNEVDGWLVAADATPDRKNLGVNTIHAISSVFLKAGAIDSGLPVYKYVNSIYNARHAATAVKMDKLSSPIITLIARDNNSNTFDFKEFSIAPTSSYHFSKALEISMNIFGGVHRSFRTTNVTGNLDIMELITKTADSLNLRLATDMFIAINFGAANYNRGSSYSVKDKPQPMKTGDYVDYLVEMTKKYFPLFLIDPVIPEDINSWKSFAGSISDNAYIVGDALTGSSPARLEKVLSDKTCSSYLIKPPLTGTITEVFEMVNLSRKHSLNYIFSTSEVETNDPLLADLTVALGGDFVRLGLPTTGENLAKYNRMIEIESEILNVTPQK